MGISRNGEIKMKFNTKRYDIRKVSESDGFNEGITHEINLKDGYKFEFDDSHLCYAEGFEDLKYLISQIVKEDL